MRYINNRHKEPAELALYRENTPGVSYDGIPKKEKTIIRESLIDEQGYICAYCMGKIINVENYTIEHYITQKRHETSPYSEAEHKKQSLLYSNMSGVCINNGDHCDKKRGNIPFEILDPHRASCEELITYDLQGNIIPSGSEVEKVKKDISTLGLNCKKLINGRTAALDEVWKRFVNEHERSSWSKELFMERAQFYRTKQLKRGKTKFHAYCNYIAWYFEYYAKNYKSKE